MVNEGRFGSVYMTGWPLGDFGHIVLYGESPLGGVVI